MRLGCADREKECVVGHKTKHGNFFFDLAYFIKMSVLVRYVNSEGILCLWFFV